jgi:hypothetical protein
MSAEACQQQVVRYLAARLIGGPAIECLSATIPVRHAPVEVECNDGDRCQVKHTRLLPQSVRRECLTPAFGLLVFGNVFGLQHDHADRNEHIRQCQGSFLLCAGLPIGRLAPHCALLGHARHHVEQDVRVVCVND